MKPIYILLLSVLIIGCDNQDRLKVSMTRTSGNDALFTLGAQPFVFDIDYTGTATSAELYVQAFKDGKLTKPYMSVGGIGGFSKPVRNPKLKIYVNIFDSRTSVMKLNTRNNIEGNFFRFASDAKYGNSEFGGGGSDITVSTDQMEITGQQTWGSFDEPDVSKEFIPVGYIKSKKTGLMYAGADMTKDGLKLEAGCDYVVFYLKLHRQIPPEVSNVSRN